MWEGRRNLSSRCLARSRAGVRACCDAFRGSSPGGGARKTRDRVRGRLKRCRAPSSRWLAVGNHRDVPRFQDSVHFSAFEHVWSRTATPTYSPDRGQPGRAGADISVVNSMNADDSRDGGPIDVLRLTEKARRPGAGRVGPAERMQGGPCRRPVINQVVDASWVTASSQSASPRETASPRESEATSTPRSMVGHGHGSPCWWPLLELLMVSRGMRGCETRARKRAREPENGTCAMAGPQGPVRFVRHARSPGGRRPGARERAGGQRR
jgi:hypothetical protein